MAEALHRSLALTTVLLRTFMASFDQGMIGVALPAVSTAFQADLATTQWVATAYAASTTSLLITFGRLGDMRGRKRVLDVGMTIFALGSLLSGLAPSILHLIAFRLVQGVGAAMQIAVGTALVAELFPESQRGKGLAMNATVVGAGQSLGPGVGGVFVELFGWRAVFFLNIPISVVALALSWRFLRGLPPPPGGQRFDPGGATTFFLGLMSLLTALSLSELYGLGSPVVLGPVAGAAALLTGFLLIESRVRQPILPLGLFRQRLFAAAISSAFLNFLARFMVLFLLPFYWVRALGFTPSAIGVLLLLPAVVELLIAPIAGFLSDRIGSRVPATVGMALVTGGILGLTQLGSGSPYGTFVTPMLALGLGNGLFRTPNNTAVMNAVSAERLGMASAVLATTRNLGRTLGIVVAVAVFAGLAAPTGVGVVAAAYLTTFLLAGVVALAATVTAAVRGPRGALRPVVLAPTD